MEKDIKRDNDKNFINRLVNKYFFIILAILILVISAITEQVLKLYNLDFRNWFRNTIFIVALISFIIGIIKINIKKKIFQKVIKSILVVCMILGIIGAIFWQYTAFFGYMFLKLLGLTTREYVMNTTYGKKVVYVDPFLTDTSVEIHDYYNPFFCSYNYEYDAYSGSYDYIDEEKIERTLKNKYEESSSTNIKENQKEEIINSITSEIIEEDEVLYKEKFGQTTIAAVCKGNWSGKHIVQILKSQDNENTWVSQLENEEGVIDVHYGTEFVFFDEKLGYYLDKGIQGGNRVNSELKYTQDGGKSFYTVKLLMSSSEIGDKEYMIEELPYLEDGKYKLKLKVYWGSEEKEYILYSINGTNFEFNQ